MEEEDADDDIYQLTREDESVHEEMWLEIMEIVATFGTIGGGIDRRARRSVLVLARHRVTDTGVFVEEKEGDESEREDADAIDAVERRVDGGDEE